MISRQRQTLLPIMLLTGLWMTGCVGSQKPKMAPANTALGTMQRAEVKLKAGQKAQAEQKYTVALEQHLDAIKMAESISTKYPKDPVTTTFQTKPMLGKTSLDALKTETIPTLRQQSMISKDLLGWALVEIEQVKRDRTRHNEYQLLFNKLYLTNDYDNAARLLETTKGDLPEKQLARMQKRLDKARAKQKKRTNLGKAYSKVLAAASLLEQQKPDEYMALVFKETDPTIERLMLTALTDFVVMNPKKSLSADKTKLKSLIVESFWSLIRPKRKYFNVFFVDKVINNHKRYGFDSKNDVIEHLSNFTNKQPLSYKRAMAKMELANLHSKKTQSAKVKTFLMASAQDTLAYAKQDPKVPIRLIHQSLYGLTHKKIITKETFAVAERIVALPTAVTPLAHQHHQRLLRYGRGLIGEPSPASKQPDLPKMETMADLNHTNQRAMRRVLRTYAQLTIVYREANQTKQLKSMLSALKGSETKLNKLHSQSKKSKDIRSLLNNNRRTQLAAYVALKEFKSIMKMLDTILGTSKPTFLIHPSNNMLDEYAISADLNKKQQAALDEKLIKLIKLDTYGSFTKSEFPKWLARQLKNKNIKTLGLIQSQLITKQAQKQFINTMAWIYIKMDTHPSDDTMAKWIVSQSGAIKFKKYGIFDMGYIIQMCQRPEAKCQSQVKAIIQDPKFPDHVRRRTIDRLARATQTALARTYLPTIQDPIKKAKAKTIILWKELSLHHDFDKIKPELDQVFDAFDKLPEEQKRRAFFSTYYIYNNHCDKLDTMLRARKLDDSYLFNATMSCAHRSYAISVPSYLAILSMTQRLPKGRLMVLTSLISKKGIVKTPEVQKMLLDTASKWKEINKKDNTSALNK